jgi:hypothetical protein
MLSDKKLAGGTPCGHQPLEVVTSWLTHLITGGVVLV